jgi:hypothetical protein
MILISYKLCKVICQMFCFTFRLGHLPHYQEMPMTQPMSGSSVGIPLPPNTSIIFKLLRNIGVSPAPKFVDLITVLTHLTCRSKRSLNPRLL